MMSCLVKRIILDEQLAAHISEVVVPLHVVSHEVVGHGQVCAYLSPKTVSLHRTTRFLEVLEL